MLFINYSFSQAIVQGYSLMYGGARADSTNSNKSKSFNGFNLDYFVKLRLSKRFYLKTNVGLARYSSKNPKIVYANVYDYETGSEYDLYSSLKERSSNLALSLGAGLDYKIKNFSIGFNMQMNPSLAFSNTNKINDWVLGIQEETFYNPTWGVTWNKYDVYSVSNYRTNDLFFVSYSLDMEYTLKRFGFKYSYLMASDRPINQFGITYNLKYDWIEVPQ